MNSPAGIVMKRVETEQDRSSQRSRTLKMATAFVEEVQREIERAAPRGLDTPPRLRSVHEKAAHASPEYRTIGIPVPRGGGASPQLLAGAVARYAESRVPERLLLALEAMIQGEEETPHPVLIAEARDRIGTRLFWMQPYSIHAHQVHWGDPLEGGWRDPGDEEMIVDAGFEIRK